MIRVLVTMTIATCSISVGQILLRLGMQQVGSLENYALVNLLHYFWRALCNPYVIGGTVFNALFYFLFLASLSWAGVAVTVPMTAIQYGFATVLAVIILKEAVTPMHWIGILLVVCGVILITLSGKDSLAQL